MCPGVGAVLVGACTLLRLVLCALVEPVHSLPAGPDWCSHQAEVA